MSDIDDDFSDLNEFESEGNNIQEADPLFISPLIVSINSINSDPPPLTDYVGDSLQMKIIAQNFHNLMSTPGLVLFNAESRSTIESAICAFVYEVSHKSVETGKQEGRRENLEDLSASQELFELTNSQLLETTTNAESLKAQIKQAKLANDKLNIQIKEQSDELEGLYLTNTQLTKKLFDLQKETDDEILEIKEKNDKLNETIISLQYSIKLSESAKTRTDKQLDESNTEIANLKSEIISLKSKLKSRTEDDNTSQSNQRKLELTIRELETENQQLTVSINDLKRNLELANTELQQYKSNISNLPEKENQHLKESLSLIAKQYESQANDVVHLRCINTSQQQIIQEFQDILSLYDKNIERFQIEKDQLQEKNSQLIETSKITMNEIDDLTKYKQYFQEIKSLIGSEISDSEIITKIESLLTPEPNLNDSKMQTLFALLENQIRFFSHFLSTHKFDLKLLTNSNSEPFSETTIQSQISMELSRAAKFLKENGIESSVINKSFDISKLTNDRELIDCYASIVVQLRLIQDLCEKFKQENSKEKAIIQKIIKGIQYDGDLNDLAGTIIDEIFSVTEKIESIKSIVNEDDEESLVRSIRLIYDVYHQFDTKIRDAIQFEGNSTELPNATYKFIQNLTKATVQNERNKMIEQQSQLSSQIKQLEEQKGEYEKTIQQKSQELLSKTEELGNSEKNYSALKSQYDDISKRQNETLSKVKESANNYAILKASFDELREKNKKMSAYSDQRVKQLEEKFIAALEEERQQHYKEIEAMKQNRISSEDRLIEKIKKMKEKYVTAKNKLKEVITTYDAAFKKQKLANYQIKAKNDQLVEELAKVNAQNNEEANKSVNENSHLEIRIKSLQLENQNLSSQINVLNEKCQQIQNYRDNYWAAQMSIKEREYKKRESVLAQSQNTFIQNLITKLSSYGPRPIEITQDYVVTSIDSLLDTLNDHQTLISNLQAELKRKI